MDKQPYILLTDDDPDILENLLTILGSQPYRLATARDGKQCLARIKEERPDLLILDLLMPRLDGWGVIRELRSDPQYVNLPIMVLTTVVEDASRRRYELEVGLAMDVQDYVQKPAKPAELIQRVEKLLKIHA
ncbi:MAG TPA: response regulator [Anaerolineae bacterium]|nr:response regulator [Anaerolineae bacterium]